MPRRTNIQRAQIFQSFDALKGFREVLREQEKIEVPKIELSEDDKDMLDWKIRQIKKGMIVSLVYYDNGKYIKIQGMVSKINFDTKLLQIVKTQINMLNIIEIEI